MNKITIYYERLLNSNSSVNGSVPGGDVEGRAYDEEGKLIARHVSSNLKFLKSDMGLTSESKHEKYKKRYPDGYNLIWVGEILCRDNKTKGEIEKKGIATIDEILEKNVNEFIEAMANSNTLLDELKGKIADFLGCEVEEIF